MKGYENGRTKDGVLKISECVELKLVAMALMLSDHIWYEFLQGQKAFHWMTYIGRLAFPIFAFQIVEGFVYTHNFRKYLGRVFLFALIFEIPFDLMTYDMVLYPYHKNVMFTFYNKTKHYSDRLKVDKTLYVRCGNCVRVCPMKNLSLEDGTISPHGKCTMCYRCISLCPKGAITLVGEHVFRQYIVEDYIDKLSQRRIK